ncbi:hypothetical protein CEP53_005768 [Fusarium sp. AF-6]|nr:hypothetical protein CEP53_005768 [Fusarium sp. AF-6]
MLTYISKNPALPKEPDFMYRGGVEVLLGGDSFLLTAMPEVGQVMCPRAWEGPGQSAAPVQPGMWLGDFQSEWE